MVTRKATSLVAGAAAAVLALAASGCGGSSGPGVASIGAANTYASSPKESWAAMYHCYATHGYPKYRVIGSPSVLSAPPISGWYKLPGNGRYGVTPAFQKLYGTAKFRAVDKICGPLMPHKTETPAQVALHVAQARKVARCMRSHGLPDLPDPDSSGLIPVSNNEYSSPKFQSAEGACQSLMTDGIPFLVHVS